MIIKGTGPGVLLGVGTDVEVIVAVFVGCGVGFGEACSPGAFMIDSFVCDVFASV